MQEHMVIEKDVSLYYTSEGEGEPLMLVHGFGEDGYIWNKVTGNLKKQFRLIIPDLPGSGQSFCTPENITIESLADNILLILEKEGIDSLTMIGHSMGGYVTLAFAEKYPDKLNKFGLFHSTAYADSDDKKKARQKNIDFIKKHGSAKFLEQAIPGLFSEQTKTNNPSIIDDLISRYSNFSPSALVAYTEAMMNRPDRIEVLKNFKKPVLFILGEYDTAVPLEQGLKQCSIPEFSYIYICTHSGHQAMLEEPEFSQNAMVDFLTGK
jgi:pimeloyl-ACP methyl ester carboxylesterase